MDLAKVLLESFRLLREAPKVFVPRLATTAVYSVFIVYSMWLLQDIDSIKDPQMMSQLFSKTLLFVSTLPLLYFMDILSYAMYPRIVADYRKKGPISLFAALKDGLKAWRIVLALGAVVFAFLMVVVSVSAVSAALTVVTGSPVFLVFAALLTLLLILFFSIVVFFVVPSAVLNGRGILESFRESITLGFENKWDLLKLNAMFMALILATMAMAYLAKADALLSAASIGVFILLRLVEAVVYTYLSVANPVAYLEVKK